MTKLKEIQVQFYLNHATDDHYLEIITRLLNEGDKYRNYLANEIDCCGDVK